jgi:curved DNA-binding protein CbpA
MAEESSNRPFHAQSRRSTRIEQAVSVLVAGRDAAGRPLQEQTATLSLNCHGCRYFSKYRVQKDSWLTVEIPGDAGKSEPRRLRARVAWVERSRRLGGLYQVAVEFEAPGNVWGVASPPEDWQPFAAKKDYDENAFARELQRLLAIAEGGNHYQFLELASLASPAEIKRRFYALARRFHPDRHMDKPEWSTPLHRLMDALTAAYKTLSDETARAEYDRQLAGSGAFALRQGKSEAQRAAEECFEKAKECLRAQNFVGSIVWLRKAVESEPGSSRYHALLARSLAAVPQFRREALEHFQRAIELSPSDTWAHFQLARLFEEMKLPWRARPHYEKVLEYDPEHRGANERLCQLDAAGKPRPTKAPLLDRVLHRWKK